MESHKEYHNAPAEKKQGPANSAEDAVDHEETNANEEGRSEPAAAVAKKVPVNQARKSMGLEQGSNSTQPTASTSRHVEEENCAIS